MTNPVRLPKMGLSMEEGRIVRWLVEAGQRIGKEEVIAEVETDKAVIELPMPQDGVIERFLAEEGSVVAVGEPIALLREESGQAAAAAAEVPQAALPASAEAHDARLSLAGAASAEQGAPHRQAVSPSARRRARELGVDVSALQGSGPGGRIVHRDIERAAEELEAALQRSAAAAPIDRRPALAQPSLPAAAASDNGVTLTAMRRTIARRMLQSVQTIPQFPLTYRIDMTNMLRIKQLIQGSLLRKQIKLSLTDFMIKAVAETLLNHKALNASFVGDPLEENCRIVEHSHVNAGLAVAVEGGLMVPVIHEAERLSIAEIAAVRMARIEALRSKSYAVSELQGGTFTLSNLGSFGAEQFQAIVNPPESFILAVGTVQDEVVAHEGRMEIRPIMRMTGTFDHRLIDGAPAAAFMQELAGRLESEDWQLI